MRVLGIPGQQWTPYKCREQVWASWGSHDVSVLDLMGFSITPVYNFLLAFLKSFQTDLQPDFFWITFLWDSVGASTHGLKFSSTHSRMFQNSPITIFLFRVYQVKYK